MIVLTHFFKSFAAPNDCFVHLFKGGAPRTVAPRRAGAPGISFWEVFLCASYGKEKVDERLIVSKVSGTNCRYENFYIAFSF
jgi:hypothetical protein